MMGGTQLLSQTAYAADAHSIESAGTDDTVTNFTVEGVTAGVVNSDNVHLSQLVCGTT